MRDIEIQDKIKVLEEQMKQNAMDFKKGDLSYEGFHAYQCELMHKIDRYKEQIKGIKSCYIEITQNDSYMIYDALTDMVFKASENECKCANGYQIQEIQELADKFSKIQIQNQW